MKVIGITTTVPVEVLIAAGYKVIDLNNLFIASGDYSKYIETAEKDGFPKSSCAWIKGIYGACLRHDIKEIVGVVQGDCSNTRALIEVLESRGIKVCPFSYPHTRKIEEVTLSIREFMKVFSVDDYDVEKVRERLSKIRGLAKRIDQLTCVEGKASGFENHLYQVMLSDFNGNMQECENMLGEKLLEMEKRLPAAKKIRLGYIGVPPMTCDLYDYVEKFDARFVYNEVQREFAFPRSGHAGNIYEQYHDYTYPYDINFRLSEIKKQIEERRLDAIIHYTQAFCHRAIEDIVIKNEIHIPVLTMEGDKLNVLDPRTKLRLEAFLDMLADLKEINQ